MCGVLGARLVDNDVVHIPVDVAGEVNELNDCRLADVDGPIRHLMNDSRLGQEETTAVIISSVAAACKHFLTHAHK